MDESANSNTDYNEELVRDSLESPIEGNNDILISTVRNAVTESLKTCEGHGCVSLSNNLAWSTMDREKKSMNDKIDRKKGNSVRPREKNMIELNKETIRKGQRKNSYWEMHQKKLGRKAPIKSEGQNEASQTSDLRNSNAAAVELHEQLVLDEILTENDRLNSFSGRKNTMFHLNNCGKEETKKFDNLTAFEKDEYKLESTRSSETNISQLGKLHYERVIGYEHQLWLPTSRNFSTVQSAPADMQPCQNPFGQGYIDFNSMTSLTSMRSDSELVNSNMTYNGIYANAKRNSRANYKPYTLSDYKKLKSESKPGGLGPDTKSEEHQQKTKAAVRKKEYSTAVRQRNTSENCKDTKKKQILPCKQISIEKQEAIARRFKALEYAKAVPKPVTSKIPNVWKSPTKAVQERQSLLAILQERHENEKKAIDAIRKDLQTKLKTIL